MAALVIMPQEMTEFVWELTKYRAMERELGANGPIALSLPIPNRKGIALAKQRGAYRGRKKSLAADQITEVQRRAGAGEKRASLAREFGISRETLYQYLRQNGENAVHDPR